MKAFLDRPVSCGEKWAAKELTHRKRCIRLLLSLTRTGTVDWRRQDTGGVSEKITNKTFRSELDCFTSSLEQEGISANTMSGYKRIVAYFLLFCQKSGYGELSDIRTNDISTFILSLYKDGRFRPSTIGSGLAGLRRFLSSNDHTAQFLLEIPVHLPREVKIMEIYNDEELTAIRTTLSSGVLTKRDTAVCRLLLETGLRGTDVCSLRLKDIDWEKDCISILQSKTKKTLVLPLRASYGNDIADYVLNERPQGGSDYVFLKTFAPFGRLGTGSIYEILKKLEELGVPVREDPPADDLEELVLRVRLGNVIGITSFSDPNGQYKDLTAVPLRQSWNRSCRVLAWRRDCRNPALPLLQEILDQEAPLGREEIALS